MALKLPSALDVMQGKVRPQAATRAPAPAQAIARPPKAERLAKAVELVTVSEDDCTNPDCPYRNTVLKARARTRLAVARYREKKAKK
jgi:hypothetical protein